MELFAFSSNLKLGSSTFFFFYNIWSHLLYKCSTLHMHLRVWTYMKICTDCQLSASGSLRPVQQEYAGLDAF